MIDPLAIPPEAMAVPLDVAAATRAYLASLPASARAASDAYFEGGYWLQLWDFLLGSGIGVLLLHTGVSARMRDLAARVTRFRAVHVMGYWVLYLLVSSLAGFPAQVYEGFFREHAYGLSNMTFGAWFGDQAKGMGIGLVLGSLVVPILYAILRRARTTWWLWGSVATIVFAGFVSAIFPVFLAPVFNQYTVLKDERVSAPILSMARANGIPAAEVWQFDASRQSNRVSANVSGFAGTERISLNDNLLNRCTLPEIEAVMGHEMGHYVLNHVYKGLLEMGIVIVLGFVFVREAFERLRKRYGARWKVEGVDDPAGLPLFGLLLGAYFFAMTPVVNTITRTQESEADIFGLNAARQPDGMAAVALKLAEYRKLEPGPVEEFVFFDHPSGRHRIEMAMRWKAEHVNDAR
jgi:STE24 endopeptidase